VKLDISAVPGVASSRGVPVLVWGEFFRLSTRRSSVTPRQLQLTSTSEYLLVDQLEAERWGLHGGIRFIPRRKANWLALLTPQGYAKCQMLILYHSSKNNELRNVQRSIKTAFVSTFISWPSLINYRYSVWSLW